MFNFFNGFNSTPPTGVHIDVPPGSNITIGTTDNECGFGGIRDPFYDAGQEGVNINIGTCPTNGYGSGQLPFMSMMFASLGGMMSMFTQLIASLFSRQNGNMYTDDPQVPPSNTCSGDNTAESGDLAAKTKELVDGFVGSMEESDKNTRAMATILRDGDSKLGDSFTKEDLAKIVNAKPDQYGIPPYPPEVQQAAAYFLKYGVLEKGGAFKTIDSAGDANGKTDGIVTKDSLESLISEGNTVPEFNDENTSNALITLCNDPRVQCWMWNHGGRIDKGKLESILNDDNYPQSTKDAVKYLKANDWRAWKAAEGADVNGNLDDVGSARSFDAWLSSHNKDTGRPMSIERPSPEEISARIAKAGLTYAGEDYRVAPRGTGDWGQSWN